MPASTAPLPQTTRATTVRYGVLTLLALAATISYLTRIGLATANTTIQREFGLSNAEMGNIIAAFFLGYTWLQLPSGWLAARFGGRVTLAGLNILASLFSIWTGLAYTAGGLWASRFGLGVAQAGLVPCASRGVVDWFPPLQRGKASSVIASAMSMGAVLASGLTALLLPWLGWRGVFFAYSAVGILWSVGYYAWFRNRPEEHRSVNPAEQDLINAGIAASTGEIPPKLTPAERRRESRQVLLAMATSSSAWLMCSQQFFRAFGAAFFFTWFPAFLEKGHGVKWESTGYLTMLPLAGSVVGSLLGGVVVDAILRRTGNRRLSRSGTGVWALGMSALCTLAATQVSNPMAMVLILSFGSLCFGMGGPAAWATGMDISGKHTQMIFALQNMWGNFGAWVCPQIVGKMFDRIEHTHGDWNQVLYMFVGIYVAGAICWVFLNPNRSAVERGYTAEAAPA